VGRGLIADDVINQIRDRVDIADIVGHHVALTKAGQNLKGLCPFHHEKSPSFTVSPSRQIFHCFGCGAGGNVFTFLTRITGASFPEVVRDLGRKVGIEVQESATHTKQSAQANRLEQLNQAAAAWFQRNLCDDHAGAGARDYLAGRGIEPETISPPNGMGCSRR
jgi:DNA primase